MKTKSVACLLLSLGMVLLFAGCSPKTSEEKVAAQIASGHALTGDERARAQTNAKSYFEKQWVVADNARGQLNECRPSDSNTNGLVTCIGFVPKPGGGFSEVKRYCGYTDKLVGCSDEDTVK